MNMPIIFCGKGLPAGDILDRVDYILVWYVANGLLWFTNIVSSVLVFYKSLLTNLFTGMIWRKVIGSNFATCPEKCNIHGGPCAEVLETRKFGVDHVCRGAFYSNGVHNAGQPQKICWVLEGHSFRGKVSHKACEISCLLAAKRQIRFETWVGIDETWTSLPDLYENPSAEAVAGQLKNAMWSAISADVSKTWSVLFMRLSSLVRIVQPSAAAHTH